MENIRILPTEQRNPLTTHIDTVSTLEMVTLMNEENKKVAPALDAVLPAMALAVEQTADRLREGGRLLYFGAGTSGRLGVLDASKCPCTFGVSPETVSAYIAGGPQAVFNAAEGCEDDYDAGYAQVTALQVSARDVVAGIVASGRTPFVLGAMQAGHDSGCLVLSITCNPGGRMDELADIALSVNPGPEVITGSTRLKSGTAQKMMLNMLSTGVMIRLGRVYENYMVYAQATNEKGFTRLKGILRDVTGCSAEEAETLFSRANGVVADAIRMYFCEHPEQTRE